MNCIFYKLFIILYNLKDAHKQLFGPNESSQIQIRRLSFGEDAAKTQVINIFSHLTNVMKLRMDSMICVLF